MYYSRPPFPHESYVVHESSRRESIGASTMHQDSPISGATIDIDEQEEVVEVQKNTGGGGRGNNGRGTDQSYGDLWEKIVQYYNQWRTEGPEVDVEKASNHWYKMSAEVSKFNGCYIQVKDTHPSGHDEDQVIEMAIKLWKNRNPTDRNFPYLHSWKILRDQQKWKEFVTKEGSKSKRTKNTVSGAYTSSSSNADASDTNSVTMMDERPPGQKAAKAAAKGKGKSTSKKVTEDATQTWNKFEELREKKGPCTRSKCTTAIRMLAYGSSADILDEYIQIGESNTIECLNKFCKTIIDVFGEVYMRRPNADDVQRLLQMHEDCHGFLGMLGSLDCMHWAWKNCPVAWKGQYTRGDHGHPTIMLEAVASVDLWIWHAYFGVAGSNNDLNVLSRSNLFQDELQGRAPEVYFNVNGTTYTMGYYLTDGIYPEWAAFVKSFSHPQDPKRLCFKKNMRVQEKMSREHLEYSKLVLQ
ncbi:uncharacterized protein LOC125494920 [Beta vulgaris subsp. vulgaris]|uniref:uncharacterized protein LOC125494920 n=1 Tax=Beta vulgaris subsp. vulgaris TaxID=3555 RepID=UPI002547456D|nr:uncharacterized protein LOC125494920 [Beta vulgaris subsp. vulgaris]